MKVRNGLLSFDRESNSLKTAIVCSGIGKAKQSFKEECDINSIIKKFGVSAKLPMNLRPVVTQDFVETFDFLSAQNAVLAARKSFESLPAKVRMRFNNDAASFVNFCSDSKNIEELRALGLANPVKESIITPKEEIVPPK